jgi:Mn-dependent DtxR family transcriptional regulator
MMASFDTRNQSIGPDAAPSLTPSQENYLEAIYRLAEAGSVQVKELACRVGVRLPSVSRAVGELARRGLVAHESYGRIELTESGREVGRQITRRKASLTRLLVDILGMAPDQAALEINRLEHAVGDEVLTRIEVLNDFALSSEGWIRRLRVRLEGRQRSVSLSAFRIGETEPHAGMTWKKKPESEHEDIVSAD